MAQLLWLSLFISIERECWISCLEITFDSSFRLGLSSHSDLFWILETVRPLLLIFLDFCHTTKPIICLGRSFLFYRCVSDLCMLKCMIFLLYYKRIEILKANGNEKSMNSEISMR